MLINVQHTEFGGVGTIPLTPVIRCLSIITNLRQSLRVREGKPTYCLNPSAVHLLRGITIDPQHTLLSGSAILLACGLSTLVENARSSINL